MSGTDAVHRLEDFGRALVVSRIELARSDRLDATARSALQRRRLVELVRHAVERSPFYRDHYRNIELDRVDLAALPPVTKSQLMARFDDWVTTAVHQYRVVLGHEWLKVQTVPAHRLRNSHRARVQPHRMPRGRPRRLSAQRSHIDDPEFPGRQLDNEEGHVHP